MFSYPFNDQLQYFVPFVCINNLFAKTNTNVRAVNMQGDLFSEPEEQMLKPFYFCNVPVQVLITTSTYFVWT